MVNSVLSVEWNNREVQDLCISAPGLTVQLTGLKRPCVHLRVQSNKQVTATRYLKLQYYIDQQLILWAHKG